MTTVFTRLGEIPVKTALPLRHLMRAGQLSETCLDDLLDAAELSGDTSRLLGFAAGYLHMTREGVPVQDVIRMAKSQKRRINLAWSPARWRTEHDKLSRAQTLTRLQEASVTYDLAAYESFLPASICQSLIRCSKRLGLEGLRQRHCVASYHDKIASGACAIASVIVDRQRWTVQLELTRNPDAPIAITQIKTRHNGIAPPDVRRRIHEIMEIALPKQTASTASAPNYVYLDNLRRVLPILEQHNIDSVTVTFSGSGDSGAIDDVYYAPQIAASLRTIPVEQITVNRVYDGEWRTTTATETVSLDQAIMNITDTYLAETDVNWYDNDGGYGELEIDVAARSVRLDVNVNYTQSENEFYETKNIDTGAVED